MISEYGIWLAILVFFLGEHIRFVDEQFAVVTLSPRNNFAVAIPRVPFQLGSKYIVVLSPLNFAHLYFLGRFFVASRATSAVALGAAGLEVSIMRYLNRSLSPLKFAEPVMAIFYFGYCPALTAQFGLLRALIYIVPTHLILLTASAIFVARISVPSDKKFCRFCLIAEMIISPGLMPALSKRLSTLFRLKADVPETLIRRVPESAREPLIEIIRERLSADGEGEAEQTRATSYLKLLVDLK